MEGLGILGAILLFNPYTEPLTTEDYAYEAAYLGLHIADWGQTRDITRRGCNNPPGWVGCKDGEKFELNPILGRDPSLKKVDKYFANTAILHAGIMKTLPRKYRRKFQYLTIGVQAGVVSHNARIGLRVKF